MNLLSEQESYWDKVAKQKEFPVPFKINLFNKYGSKEKTILEVGCGYGRILNEFNQRDFKNLFGVDVS